MAKLPDVSDDDLSRLWNEGHTPDAIAKALRVSRSWIYTQAERIGLPRRRTQTHSPNKPPQHKAAVLMPSGPLEARKDWPELKAAVERAQGHSGPVVALGMIAARFRLPVAVVQGLAGRLWK